MRKRTELRISDVGFRIGIVVDAGPSIGYGHAVRCVRLGRALQSEAQVIYYPLSDACERFLHEEASESEIRSPKSDVDCPVVISDLREPRPLKAERLISIHDLGLSQCKSDVVIDGSITQVFAYPHDRSRKYFVGPEYMITRDRVTRGELKPVVLVSLGAAACAASGRAVVDSLNLLGLHVVTSHELSASVRPKDPELTRAIATCAFAVSTAGGSLYDLLASGVPTIAVAVNRLQLRTAMAFQERGAVICAGMIESLSSADLLRCSAEILKNFSLAQQLASRGQELVDGKGLSRVLEIVRGIGMPRRADVPNSTRRRHVWLKKQDATYTNC
jgi:spore coat polysaccharide biosynthesis predicted glycosyltransferase SpsG